VPGNRAFHICGTEDIVQEIVVHAVKPEDGPPGKKTDVGPVARPGHVHDPMSDRSPVPGMYM